MKLDGVKISEPNYEIVIIPRPEKDLVFRFQAVLDYDDFDKLCPQPQVPEKILPGNRRVPDTTNPGYIKLLDEWAEQKTRYMFLKSIEATKTLEWDMVDITNPDTWANYREELKEAGFSQPEIIRLLNGVTSACGLSQSKIDEATERFLAAQEQTSER